jgi:hypothetical protein
MNMHSFRIRPRGKLWSSVKISLLCSLVDNVDDSNAVQIRTNAVNGRLLDLFHLDASDQRLTLNHQLDSYIFLRVYCVAIIPPD